MKLFLYITVIISTTFLMQCAQQVSPTGGDKDSLAPILDTNISVAVYPPDRSINFSAQKIFFQFNEYFKLDNPRKQIIITPAPDKKPTFTIKGRKLFIDFNEPLKENTTYTINFGNAIKDITEGNTLENFRYVFSTGSVIDSLSLSGIVYNAESKKPVEGALIMLYENLHDSVPLSTTPYYFTKTNMSGSYQLNYLKEGVYKIVALMDKNKNYLFDQEDELIGFPDEPILLSTYKEENLKILVFKEEPSIQKVKSKTYTYPGKISLELNKYSSGVKVEAVGKSSFDNQYLEVKPEDKLINLWLDSSNLKSSSCKIRIYDKENQFTDTLKIPIKKSNSKDLPYLKISHNIKTGLDLDNDIQIEFDSPIKGIDHSKIWLFEDTIPQLVTIQKSNSRSIVLKYNWNDQAAYKITFGNRAFENIYGNTNDSLNVSFRYKSERDYGNAVVQIEPDTIRNYVLELYNRDDKFSDTTFNSESFKIDFKNLTPGKYSLRLIFDTNDNGKWDTGNYALKIKPERVEYFGEPIDIRPGWDKEITWKIEK